jgi:Zn-dependent protease
MPAEFWESITPALYDRRLGLGNVQSYGAGLRGHRTRVSSLTVMPAHFLEFFLAWFIQMGVHEGAHAWAAWRCGDDTAYLLGKRSIDPFRHIQWNQINSVLLAVVLPAVTAWQYGFPMGMAWVPVNPLRFKKMRRDHAIVSAAGPVANLLLSIVVLLIGIAIAGLPDSNATEVATDLCYAVYITSIVYGAFNMIPLPPLDGSRVLYYFLPPSWRAIMEDIEPYGFWIMILLFGFGSGAIVIRPVLSFAMIVWQIGTQY